MNLRPHGPQPCALPNYAMLREIHLLYYIKYMFFFEVLFFGNANFFIKTFIFEKFLPKQHSFAHIDISLAGDVLVSAVSAYTYGKNKNLDIRNGLVMMASVLCFTLVGSFISSLLPSQTMGSFSVFMTLMPGIKFIVRPVMTTKEAMTSLTPKKRFIQSNCIKQSYRYCTCGSWNCHSCRELLIVANSELFFHRRPVPTQHFLLCSDARRP